MMTTEATYKTTHDTFTLTPEFVLAGHAIFTVHNATGDHYTYLVEKVESDGKAPVWFAKILTGSDNESDYTYVGVVGPDGSLRLTRASKMTADSQPVAVAQWALGRIWTGRATSEYLPDGYGIHGEGRCGRCGRTLTAPDGITPDGYRFGFGPTCWEKLQSGE